MSRATIQIYYGEGHGKSTAAIGSAIKTATDGEEAIVIQFLKGKNALAENFLNRLEPEIKCFNFAKSEEPFCELDEDRQQEEIMNLRNGFNYGKKVVSTGTCKLIVFDEILGLIDQKVITFDEVKELIDSIPEYMTVIFTGRVFDERLRPYATEIYNIAPEK